MVYDEYEYGMKSERDNGSTRRKHRKLSFFPLQILNHLPCYIDVFNGILHFISHFHVVFHPSCKKPRDEVSLANLALTVLSDDRSLFAAFIKSNHFSLSNPPSHTKFLFKDGLVLSLGTVKNLFRLSKVIFCSTYFSSMVLIFHI